jgi:hypothetical protein
MFLESNEPALRIKKSGIYCDMTPESHNSGGRARPPLPDNGLFHSTCRIKKGLIKGEAQ